MLLGMDILCWLLLITVLIIGTFGLFTYISISFSILIAITSALISLSWIFEPTCNKLWSDIHRSQVDSSQVAGLPKVKNLSISPSKEDRFDKRITGSSIIDDQLQCIIRYLIKDFILSWYTEISGNPQFVVQLQQGLQQSIVSISNRCKSTDWVGYLTTRLVDDVATHLRLFREAKFANKHKDSTKSLIDHFFEIENEKEKGVCRNNICLKPDSEKDYLSDLIEVVLYLTIPQEEFGSMPLRSAVIEIIVSHIVVPLIDRLSEPDYINSLIVWASTDIPVTSELFISVVKGTSDSEELESIRKSVSKEIHQLRSRDSGGRDEGTEVKQQIGSLEYLRQVIDSRLHRIDKGPETDSLGLPINFDCHQISRGKLFQLPIDVILKNNITLDYFLKYMSTIDSEHYVNLYLNIECWKTTVSERFCALELERIHHLQQEGSGELMHGLCYDYFSSTDLSAHKAEADMMYEQYLSEKANPRVHIDDSIVKRLILRLRSEKLNENWFDETRETLLDLIRDTDQFLPAFMRSVWYIRLLAELDLLRDISRSDEEDSQSLDEISVSCLDQDDEASEAVLQGDTLVVTGASNSPRGSGNSSKCHTRSSSASFYTLSASIIGSEIVREGNKSYAIYKVKVIRKDIYGREEVWPVSRRYSEFHDLHMNVSAKFLDLASIPFPSKKMLNNLATWFLEKRMNELSSWLTKILMPSTLQSHPGLQDIVYKFLEIGSYQSSHGQGNLAKKVEESLMAPIKSGVKSVSSAVMAVPDTVFSTVDGVVEGLYKKLKKPNPSGRYSIPNSFDFPGAHRASVELETEENIPLRIVLLLMDEVFDLRSKDQWFRRRIVLFLRQVLKAMFGDIVNRRIVDFVEYITSPERVSHYIKSFKDSFWPNGVFTSHETLRDEDVAFRTKIAARTCMLASISDEFKAILGSQTTSRGVLNVYECVQWKSLNKRLIYVLLNGLMEAVFSSQKEIPSILRTLNSSNRIGHRRQPSHLRAVKLSSTQ